MNHEIWSHMVLTYLRFRILKISHWLVGWWLVGGSLGLWSLDFFNAWVANNQTHGLLILQVLIFLIFSLFFWCWFKGEILGVRYFLIWLQFQLGSSDAYSNQLLSLACLNGYNVFSRIYFDGSASRQVRWSISTELAGTFRMASV